MEDPAKFDVELEMPLPGSNARRARRAPSPQESQAANRDLQSFASWAQMQGGGAR